MKKKILPLTFIALLVLAAVAALVIYIKNSNVQILAPGGQIASQQRDLMVAATLLVLIVVLPVFVLTFTIAWRYRAGNTKAKYMPEWDHHGLAELSWWAIPSLIILVLAVMTWKSSHQLDPFRPVASANPPITIQVVALQWKWLFIYPDHNVASVNYVRFPQDTPVNFEITADSPMNSFWIPRLGGQIYAMPGMVTKIHLVADDAGSFRGSSANLSGSGFAGMRFTAEASTYTDFIGWIGSLQHQNSPLRTPEYNLLAQPSLDTEPIFYSPVEAGLHGSIVKKFMSPAPGIMPPHGQGQEYRE